MCDTRVMRRPVAALVIGSLLLLSCGSDESSVETVVLSTTAVDATAPPADTTVADVGALVPTAVCQGFNGEVYFGYTNESSEPIVVAEGADNALDGVTPDDNPLLTSLFAPGTVEVAFWAFPVEGSEADVVWTLTGPDGVERTASGGLATAPCPADFLATVDRLPTLEVADAALAADGESAQVDLRLNGIDATSVCNEAFTAEPALVSIDDGSAFPTAFEPEVTLTLGPFAESANGGRLASTRVYALIVDQCVGAGVTASSWFPPPALDRLSFGTEVCARLDDAGTLAVDLTGGSCDLGITGGSSIRPR